MQQKSSPLALINYAEYFDLDGFNKAIKDLETANKEFGGSVLSLNKEIKTSYNGIRSELKDYADTLSKFNVNQRDAAPRMAEMGVESQKLIARFKEQQQSMQALTQVQDLSRASLRELKAAGKELQKQYSDLGGASDGLNAKKAALAEESRRITEAIKLQQSALKSTKKVIEEAAGSYAALNTEALDVLRQLKAMPNAFDATTGKINQNNKAAVDLQDRYIKLNNTLKSIDGGLGNFQRNVGNYKSGFNGLGNSINQITREFPAFSNSLQTGFLALSNNIPIFFDEITKVNTQLNEMKARGEKVPSVLSAIGKSFLTFNTLLSLGVTLLTVYGKDIVEFGESLLFGAKGVDTFKESVDSLSAAYKSSDYKDAVSNVNELNSAVDLAKKGFIDKKDVVNKYNETIGKTTGIVLDLAGVEQKLAEKGEAYIKFTLLKAQATALLAKSAEAAANAEVRALKGPSIKDALIGAITNPGNKFGAISGGAKNFREEVDVARKDAKALEDLYRKINEEANKFAKENGLNILGNSKVEKGGESRVLNEYRRLLDGREKALKEAYDKEVLLAQSQLDQRLIDEIQFQDIKYQAAVRYTRLAAQEEVKANKVGFKAREDKLAEFNNFRIESGNEYLKTLIKLDEKQIEARKLAIQAEADLKIESLKDAQKYELANQMLTNAQKVQLEIDYQNKIDEISIQALLDRAALEVDIARRTELLKQASTLKVGVGNRTAFGANVSVPQAEAQDQIRALEIVLQRRKVLGIATIQDEIATATAIYNIRKKVDLDTRADEEKLFELKKRLQDEIVNYLKAGAASTGAVLGAPFEKVFDDIIDGLQRLENKGKITFENIAQFASDGSNLATFVFKDGIDQMIRASQFQKDQELAAVGNNASARAAIEAKFAREQAILNRKKAVADRDNALFQIGINTSQAVVKSVAESPLTFGLPWSGYALGLGALQAALVLSRKIPQFKGGTENSPEGPAIVDDGGGAELIIGPDGRIREIGGKGPRITYLERGSKVKTASETKRMLSDPNSQIVKELAYFKNSANSLSDYKQKESIYTLSKAMEMGGMDERIIATAFEKAVQKIPIKQTIIDRHGERLRVIEGNHTTTYLNSFKLGR